MRKENEIGAASLSSEECLVVLEELVNMWWLSAVENSGDDLSLLLDVTGLEQTDQHLVVLAHEVEEEHKRLAVLLALHLAQSHFPSLTVKRTEKEYEILDIVSKEDGIGKEIVWLYA